MAMSDRLWAKIDKNGPVRSHRPDLGQCWEWLASKTKAGYGKFSVANSNWRFAHRVTYELLVGPIPEGLVLDHLCRNRGCVNPSHLEPKTRGENLFAEGSRALCKVGGHFKRACVKGHPYPENRHVTPGGTICCLICRRARDRARYELLKNRRTA